MNINDLTIGQAKELSNLFNQKNTNESLNSMIGKKVIVRTYSSGNWFGELEEKSGREVILKNARRMYRWWAKESISLSACAIYGVKPGESKIVEAVASVWLEATEIIPCTKAASEIIEGCENVQAK